MQPIMDPWDGFECRAIPPDVQACVDVRALGPTYAYLFGLYLGDGCISQAHRNVFRLRIFQDQRYPGLVASCSQAVEEITGRSPGQMVHPGCIEIYSNWKHWPCLFPQMGPGRKHERTIALDGWQRRLVERHPKELVRGLIHSDGCRVTNRVRRPTLEGVKTYAYPRYFFTNASADIRGLFMDACGRIGVACRRTTERNLSVAHRASVRILDGFIGPKS